MRNISAALIWLLATVAAASPRASAMTISCFADSTLGVSFQYPTEWGIAKVVNNRDQQTRSDLLQGADMDWSIGFAASSDTIWAFLRVRHVTPETRYRIVWYEGYADTTDLLELREAIAAHPDTIIAGFPARTIDKYFEPSACSLRSTEWFSDEFYFEFIETAFWDPWRDSWARASKAHGMQSLIDANRDDSHLRNFKAAVTRILGSMKCTR